MSFSLLDFEQQIDPVILKRGEKYWEQGKVIVQSTNSDGEVLADVLGAATYQVSLFLKQNEVVDFSCTCPYDHGPVCKHLVALLFELNQPVATLDPRKKTTQAKKAKMPRHLTLKSILKKVSDDDLRTFVEDYATKDKMLHNALMLRFAQVSKTDAHQDYKQMIQLMIKAAKDRSGFIGYDKMKGFAKQLIELSESAQKWIDQEEYAKALPLIKALLEGLIPCLNHVDDSSGHIGGIIEESFKQLSQVASQVEALPSGEQLLADCLAQARKKVNKEWGFDLAYLSIAVQLAQQQEQANLILQFLDQETFSDFRKGTILELRYFLINRFEGQEKGQAFLHENRAYDDFRVKLINQHLEAQEYEEAKMLAEEGLGETAKEQELRKPWKSILLQIAEKTNDRKAALALTREVFLHQRGTMALYGKLKAFYTEKAWPAEVNKMLKQLAKYHWMGHERIGQMLLRENRLDQLMDWLETSGASLDEVKRYEEQLIPQFTTRILRLYEEEVRYELRVTQGRKSYQRVCRMMKKMKQLGGQELVQSMAQEFLVTYKARKALREEMERFFLV